MKKALLVRFGGLGDLLVALPSIRLIRGKYPDARLTLACRGEYGALLQETGVVDEIIPEDSLRLLPLFSEAPTAETEGRERLGSFDLIMGWTHGQKGYFSKRARAAAARTGEIHFIHINPQESGPLNRFFFRKTAEILGGGGALSIDEWAYLPTGRLQRALGSEGIVVGMKKKRGAVVHPGSGSESKRWPLENFLRIIGRLGERGVAGALATGEAEERMAAEIERAALPHNWSWVRRPGLTALASLLSETSLYLGNDSGVTHLAAACGAEVVALFRREYASAWAPLGRVHLHIADSLSEISPESVWETVASRLPNFSADSQNC
jgi:ADP-heptose:LPS heptosyltransferase